MKEGDVKSQNKREPYDTQLLPTNTAPLLHILLGLTSTEDPVILLGSFKLVTLARRKTHFRCFTPVMELQLKTGRAFHGP